MRSPFGLFGGRKHLAFLLCCGVWGLGVGVMALAGDPQPETRNPKPESPNPTPHTPNSTAETTGKQIPETAVEHIVVKYDFQTPSVAVVNGHARLDMPGLPHLVHEGKPIVPFKTAKILLPPSGAIAEVNVEASGRKVIPGRFELELGRAPQPLRAGVGGLGSGVWGLGSGVMALAGDPKPETPNPMPDARSPTPDPRNPIPHSPSSYPGLFYELASVQKLRGYRIAILRLFPVQYLASSGQVSYYQTLTVTLKLSSGVWGLGSGLQPETRTPKPDTRYLTPQPPNFRGRAGDEGKAVEFVDNPELIKAYPPAEEEWGSGVGEQGSGVWAETRDPTPDTPSFCEYLIITKSSYASSFEPLLDWKKQKGLTGSIAAVEDIKEGYEGADLQEKIRNFITECYENLGTEYVLLGGDVEIIPYRATYGEVGAYTDERIPCDLYYGCLDGTWDYNRDGIYGESEDGEDGGEIDLVAEVYVGRAPVSSPREAQNFVRKTLQYEAERSPNLAKALWVGEGLDSKTWGSDSKEELAPLLPESFEVTKLYEKKGAFSSEKVIAELNDSPHIINHLGHSTQVKVIGMWESDVADLTNEYPFFFYTQGCDAGAFDYDDSIAEDFVKAQRGAFAVIANSRFGWYAPETTLGTSQAFDEQFLYALFGKGITNLGRTLQESKEANIGDVFQTGATRWCYFEINLLGDPETPLFTATSKGLLRLDAASYSPKTPIRIELADIDLNTDPLVTEVVAINLRSPGDIEQVFALETDSNSGVFAAEIPLSTEPPALDGVLQIKDGDTVTALYEDADDGSGSPQTVTATAVIDDSPPSIYAVRVADVRDTWAVIEWQSDEVATARVDFGVSPPFGSSASSDVLAETHRVVVSDLEKETVYRFSVVAADSVGNEAVDDNGGEYYSFKTKHQFVIFFDDVEEGGASAAGEWAYQVVSGGVGDWQITTADFRSQTACWHSDDYDFPSANVLDTPLIDLRGMVTAQLSFWHRMLSETDWDGGFVQVRREGTDNWCSLTQEEMMEGTPFVTLSVGNPSGAVPGWSGSIPWERVTFDLSEYVGNRLVIRFGMESDDNTDAGEGDGWYIDDISVLRAMGTVNLDKAFYRADEPISITVLDAAANSNAELLETVSVEVSSTTESSPEVVTLTETGANSATFVGEILAMKGKTSPDGKITVRDNDIITVSYEGAEAATAIADLTAPTIRELQSTQVSDSFAMITWITNEPCRGIVYYGTDAAELSDMASEPTPVAIHQVRLYELQPRSTYYFKVECLDRAGNVAIDDNDGSLHSFLTLGFSQGGLITEDTVWRYVEGHPYVISGSVFVGTGSEEKPVTLTIEPGVVVQFKTNKRELFVQGRIVARGVTFEFDLFSGKTAHIILKEGSSGIIDNSVISVLGPSEETPIGIECYSSHIAFTNNIVRNAYYGFHCLSSSPKISGNTFIVCKFGVFCHAAAGENASPVITDNTFIRCDSPILCEPASYPVVSGNVFDGNKYDGLIHSSIAGDTVWPAHDCPQLITRDLTVPADRTLVIAPGARIRFVEAGADLSVFGSLYAEGATIEFEAPADPPTFLNFSSTASGGIRNCRILGKAPDGSPTGGIRCQSSSVYVTGNVISDTYYGVFCEPFEPPFKSPLIANNTIVGCQFGVYAPDASPNVINCILWNNGDDLVGCGGSFLDTMDGDAG